ncbi:MAG TPA: YncE family protein [Armatimonadota bacterium]|jgi:YVTN family beta-propeller protein
MKRTLTLAVLLGLGVPCGAQTTTPALAAPATPGYHIVKKTVLGGEGGWDCLMVNPTAKLVYITRGTHVMVVDEVKHTLVANIPEVGGVHGVALDRASGHGFVTNGQDNTVAVFDQATRKPAGSVKVGQNPDVILYDRTSRRLFSMNGASNDATAIDPATNLVLGTVPLNGKPEFAVADGKGTIFVNLEDKSEVAAFDAKTLKVTKRWSIAPGDGPTGIAFDRTHRRVFSACGNGKMIVSDPDTGMVVATVPIGNGPDGATYDARLGLAFSPNGRDGTLTVIHEDAPGKYTVVETVPTQAGARTMALDLRTHHVFLVTADPDTTPPAAGENPRRRRFKPGTFTLIELAPR